MGLAFGGLLVFAWGCASAPPYSIGLGSADAVVPDTDAVAAQDADDTGPGDDGWARDPRCAVGYCECCGLCQFAGDGKQCIGLTDADCEQSTNCLGPKSMGKCMLQDGHCVVGPDSAACAASGVCLKLGNCAFVNGTCRPGSLADCQAAVVCKTHGRCSFVLGKCPQTDIACGACVPQTDADCAGSDLCKIQGKCHYVVGFGGAGERGVHYEGGCHPSSAADCEQSVECKQYGRCTYKAGKKDCLLE